MISAAAKDGVHQIFTRAAQANLIVSASDSIEIHRLPTTRIQPVPEQRALVLTISSYVFRLLTLIHYSPNRTTDAYFNRSDSALSAKKLRFDDAFGEVGNLCCGAMKRELGNHFMHLGMSTPYTLDNTCMEFLDMLKPSHVSQYRVLINAQVSLHVTLCLCAWGEIDFTVRAPAAPEASGALELF